MIRVITTGTFNRTKEFLNRMKNGDFFNELDAAGRRGVQALSAATPKDSGLTAASWTYRIERSAAGATIIWDNTHDNKGEKVAVLIQYGHGTGTGGYVLGRDYINPAMVAIFDQIANDVWKKVTNG